MAEVSGIDLPKQGGRHSQRNRLVFCSGRLDQPEISAEDFKPHGFRAQAPETVS
jgi:hypothetical protein